MEQAYKALCEQAYALLDEFEASQIISEVSEFETEYLEKQTADELSIAGGLTLGLAIFHSTMKVLLPSRVAGPVVGSAWVLGGAYFVFRLTSTTIRGWVGQTERNKRRKRRILVSANIFSVCMHFFFGISLESWQYLIKLNIFSLV